jgi:hypothetical protein
MTTTFLESPTVTQRGECELQHLIDASIGRALFDAEYANELLANPTIVLGEGAGTPQQQVALGAIRAANVNDFARQAVALFWPTVRPRRADSEAALAAAL